MTFNSADILAFLIIYQCLLFVIFLLINKKTKPFFIKMLLLICSCIGIHFVILIFGDQFRFGGLWLGPFFGLLYGPLYLHFSQSLIYRRKNVKQLAWHYVPALLIMVCALALKDGLWQYLSVVSIVVTVHFTVYLIIILRAIHRFRFTLKSTHSSFIAIDLKWLEIAVYVQILAVFVAFIEGFISTNANANYLVTIVYILVLILVNCLYYFGFKHVGVFSGFRNPLEVVAEQVEFSLDEATFTVYVSRLEEYLTVKKPYLEFDISLRQIATETDINPRNLSYTINKAYGCNFYEFINKHRLEVAKDLIRSTDKQIKEVMFDSGFSNKSTFNTFFKKHTGKTPTQYRASLKK